MLIKAVIYLFLLVCFIFFVVYSIIRSYCSPNRLRFGVLGMILSGFTLIAYLLS